MGLPVGDPGAGDRGPQLVGSWPGGWQVQDFR